MDVAKHYEGDWLILAMLKKFLQGKSAHQCQKDKRWHEELGSDIEPASIQEGGNFDPLAVLEYLQEKGENGTTGDDEDQERNDEAKETSNHEAAVEAHHAKIKIHSQSKQPLEETNLLRALDVCKTCATTKASVFIDQQGFFFIFMAVSWRHNGMNRQVNTSFPMDMH